MSSGKVLLGVLAGVAAGALLGVLFAPDKGTVTRKAISKKAEDYAEALRKSSMNSLTASMKNLKQKKKRLKLKNLWQRNINDHFM